MTIVNNSLFTQMQNMSIEAVGSQNNSTNNDITNVNQTSNKFGDLLASALESVNDLHQDAGKKTKAFMLGDSNITLAEIMVSRSKAGIATDATIQVRNKAIDGYKEIMSMPV